MKPSRLRLAVLAAALSAFALWVLLERGYLRLNYPSRAEYPLRGVDVSHHQGTIDWVRLARAGNDFAYIKASEGVTFRDSRFAANWSGAESAGVLPGAYHFFTLCAPGADQAGNFLDAAPPSPRPSLPPAVDLEFGGNCGRRPTPEAFAVELQRFLQRIETAWGRRAVLYVTSEFYRIYLEGRFPENPLWVRDIFWTPRFTGERGWRFWQYASRGRLPGVRRFVALTVIRGTAREFAGFTASP